MATKELLIKVSDNINSDPLKDPLCYKAGDIVEIRDKGSKYGKLECWPTFLIVEANLTLSQEQQLIESNYGYNVLTGVNEMTQRRKYTSDFMGKINQSLLDEIVNSEQLLIPKISGFKITTK